MSVFEHQCQVLRPYGLFSATMVTREMAKKLTEGTAESQRQSSRGPIDQRGELIVYEWEFIKETVRGSQSDMKLASYLEMGRLKAQAQLILVALRFKIAMKLHVMFPFSTPRKQLKWQFILSCKNKEHWEYIIGEKNICEHDKLRKVTAKVGT